MMDMDAAIAKPKPIYTLGINTGFFSARTTPGIETKKIAGDAKTIRKIINPFMFFELIKEKAATTTTQTTEIGDAANLLI
ncbi:hypothetical protein [Citrobacter freundii]|uniref:hypothetical protein n=1 Tax=Citrobacter freundii TaxID=546 RepID=UPI003CEFC7B3